jgi:hypothetical protein
MFDKIIKKHLINVANPNSHTLKHNHRGPLEICRSTRRADMDEEMERGLYNNINIIQNGYYVKYTTRQF